MICSDCGIELKDEKSVVMTVSESKVITINFKN